jgi:MFS family permease
MAMVCVRMTKSFVLAAGNGSDTDEIVLLVLWTVSSLVICNAFPTDSQGLAGGVFNTISQLGNSVGLAVTAAIAASVTSHDGKILDDTQSPHSLLQGYRSAYWTIFSAMAVVCVASILGLRKAGKVGVKRD